MTVPTCRSAFAALTLAGCASLALSTASAALSAAPDVAVTIKNFDFQPMAVTVPVGATVTWKFDDSTQHTVTADDNSFASAPMGSGQTYTHTFTTAGTVPYHCSIHPSMTATIIVK